MDDAHIQRIPLSKADFLYQRSGPWPQPAPDHPMAMAAEVLHLPESELEDWNDHVGSHYGWMLFTRWPLVAWNALSWGGVAEISDALFAELMTTTIYSKFLRPLPADDEHFASVRSSDPDLEYYTADYTPIRDLQPYPGMYVAPTVTLFARTGSGAPFRAVAMRIGHRENGGWKTLLLTPSDTNAWTLAKYFALQGAAHWVTLGSHPLVHFVYDAMNAITKSALPTRHAVFQLLYPHLRLELAVNNAVLEGGYSVVSETRGEIYAPFVADGTNVRQLVVAGYLGYPNVISDGSRRHGPSFPEFTYPMGPPSIPSDYGTYLTAYYGTIRAFVKTVVDYVMHESPHAKQEMHFLRRWADYVAAWTPGFPAGDHIFDEREGEGICNLVAVLTTFIWDVSVLHSADHSTFYNLRPERTPFRVRVPPPTRPDVPPIERRKVLGPWDLFQSGLAFEMFFRPNNIVALPDVAYAFTAPALVAAAGRFRDGLRRTEADLVAKGIRVEKYARLADIATSIQY